VCADVHRPTLTPDPNRRQPVQAEPVTCRSFSVTAARQDFRTRYETLTYEITSVPADVADSCHAYLKALGLELGVFDFAVTDDGAWWFLECGPGSQWAWLQEETGAPIADAIADTLTGGPA
jgi:hypothetical protein